MAPYAASEPPPEQLPSSADPIAQARVRDLITGFMSAQAIHAAVQVGLPTAMHAHGAQTVGALADATGTHAPSLGRLLRALAALGLVDEGEDGRFALTASGGLL